MSARRDFLRRLGGMALGASALAAVRLGAQQPEPPAGQGESGSLRDPLSAGRPQERKTARDNDEWVREVEQRMQCTCGCTLDIYTCRTTDFTCTYSPALHKEVLALKDEGKSQDEIVAAFVAKYGEKILMAPKPEGFNLAGYIVPGSLILLAGGVMAFILMRRSRLMRPQAAVAGGDSAARPEPVPTAGVAASQEEMDRLDRAIRELDQ